MAWRAYIPMDGARDGLANVQLIGRDMLIGTRSGMITLLNAETGEARWRTRVGIPYRPVGMPTANSRTVLAVSNTYLYALDRATGQLQWQFRLPGGVSAPLAVDEDNVYVPGHTGRLYCYYLPNMEAWARRQAEKPPSTASSPVNQLYETSRRSTGSITHFSQSVREAGEEVPTGPHPELVWNAATNLRLETRPILGRESILALGAEGVGVGIYKAPRETGGWRERFSFDAEAPIHVPAGKYGEVAYVGATNANLYAVSLVNGRVLWRYTAGQPVSHRPAALAEDVYVAASDKGLLRLDRSTGEPLWRVARGRQVRDSNVDASRFLAANQKFVYAQDRIGRLMVLDRRLGHTLSTFDVRQFVFPVINELSDRLYLAANDGFIVCLHDKEYTTALRHHSAEEALLDRVRARLAQPISDAGGKQVTLRELLDGLADKYRLKFNIDDRAFKDASIEPIGPKLVTFPAVQNKPLGEVLQQILASVGARYDIIEDTILILPAAPGPKAP
jgi:outer membrane protein assembly factor BamB